MPVNLGGKRYAANRKRNNADKADSEFPWAEDQQMYGRVERMLGSSRMRVTCSDKTERTATIRGSMRKRAWINVGDIVLISTREFEEDGSDSKVDVIYKYSQEHVRYLRRVGELKSLDAVGEDEDPNLIVVFDDAEADEVDVEAI